MAEALETSPGEAVRSGASRKGVPKRELGNEERPYVIFHGRSDRSFLGSFFYAPKKPKNSSVARLLRKRGRGTRHWQRHTTRGNSGLRPRNRDSDLARRDVNLRRQRAVNRALVRNFQEPRALFCRQRSGELDESLDLVEHSFLGLAFGTINRVNLRVPQRNGDSFQRPSLATRVHGHCHGRATSECGQQKIVGGRSRPGPSGGNRFIGRQPMRTCRDLLGESDTVAADDDLWRSCRFRC